MAPTWSSGYDVVERRGRVGNRVSKTRFQIGVISKLTPYSHSHTDQSPLSLTLSLTQTPLSLTLSFTQTSLMLSLTLFSHSHSSPSIYAVSQGLHIQRGVQSVDKVCSFSLRGLSKLKKKKKKGESSKCVSLVAKKQWEKSKIEAFFYFGFNSFFSILVSVLNF